MVYLYTGRRAIYPIVCPPQTLFYDLPAPPGPGADASARVLEAHRPAYVVLMPRAYGGGPFREWVDGQAEQQREIRELLEIMLEEKINS